MVSSLLVHRNPADPALRLPVAEQTTEIDSYEKHGIHCNRGSVNRGLLQTDATKTWRADAGDGVRLYGWLDEKFVRDGSHLPAKQPRTGSGIWCIQWIAALG